MSLNSSQRRTRKSGSKRKGLEVYSLKYQGAITALTKMTPTFSVIGRPVQSYPRQPPGELTNRPVDKQCRKEAGGGEYRGKRRNRRECREQTCGREL